MPPGRAQYLRLKDEHPDALLLFRMGDFYETFDEDAQIASAVLGIALTSRPMGRSEGRIPLAGIPIHALDRYLDRLIAAGHRVAIAEQVSAPGNGLVDRRIVRVVTPGTVDEGSLLQERGHNWLAALAPPPPGEGAAGRWGVAACDVTTGELECRVLTHDELTGEWARLTPREVLVPASARGGPGDGERAADATAAGDLDVLARVGLPAETLVSVTPTRVFDPERARRALCEQLGVQSLDGYGLEGLERAVGAAGAVLHYLGERWPGALAHLRAPRPVRRDEVVYLDPQTRRNLDLFSDGRQQDASLVATLDRTETAMGGRLLRHRLGQPLRVAEAIERRLDAVEAFTHAPLERAETRQAMHGLPDLERLLGRVRAGTATARHFAQLGEGLGRLPAVQRHAAASGQQAAAIAPLGTVARAAEAIASALADDPPSDIAAGGTIRAGFDSRVDSLRRLTTDAREALAALESAEREASGITNLKVGHNRVLGYYLEVSRRESDRVPEHYEHRQTLTNAVRYRLPSLTDLEQEIVSAADQLLEAERELLEALRLRVVAEGPTIEQAAATLAQVDVAAALADLAEEHGYVRPLITESGPLLLTAARHPVVEQRLPAGAFVPNNCALGGRDPAEGSQAPDIVVLTGPNMGGKSTYLRQVALCVLLAQCGSFVPATAARIPVVDRIFSRVGAQDDIASGQSTFMVEMLETAQILHNATERSLVILDEIGRGTSTYDGLAIARAVVEHLHHRPGGAPHTIFATHYHELTVLAETLPGVASRSVAVAEEDGAVVFLHRIVDGGADRSYGVHVAELAGMPPSVLARARALLEELERDRGVPPSGPAPHRGESPPPTAATTEQVARDAAFWQALADLDPDALTPREAHQRLYALQEQAQKRLSGPQQQAEA